MASAVPEEVTERLTCAVCMEQFKEPKVLPCLHTYCKACLEKLVKKQGSDHIITCPECRQDSKVPDGDASKLQPNFWVNNFMTLLSMQDSASSTGSPLNCEHCDSGDSAVSRCSDCSVFMCEFCVTAHKRINATKSHQILSLVEVKKLGSKALVKPTFCSKHKGETLKLFCSTCQKTICRDCTIVDHREHKYDFVTDVAEKEKDVIQGFLTKAKVKEHAVVDGIKAVRTMKNGVQKRVSEVNKEVDAFYDEQVKALNYYRANIKHEVSTEGQIRVSKLENQADVLSSFLAQLRSGISFTNQALQDGDDVKLLAMKKQLVQQLDQLNSSKTSCKPCKDDYLELQVHQTIWDMGKIVSVCCAPFDPQKCTVSLVGGEEGVMYQTLAGQEVDLLLLVKDGKGQKKPKGGHHVEAVFSFCFASSLVGANSPVPVRDNGDGSYSFSYHPVEEGNVNLSVRVEKKEVCGSPFKWNVISKLPDGASSPQRKVCTTATYEDMGFEVRSEDDFLFPGPSVFTEGMYCWKLQLTSLNDEIDSELEIGVTASGYNSGGKFATRQQQCTSGKYGFGAPTVECFRQQQQEDRCGIRGRRGKFAPQQQQYTSGKYGLSVPARGNMHHSSNRILTTVLPVQQYQQEKWSWKYSSFTKSPQSSRSDGQIPSITSVEVNDVFIVFLNLETQKLTIYNVRSKQTEIFTGIEGGVSSITRSEYPNAWGGKKASIMPYQGVILGLQ